MTHINRCSAIAIAISAGWALPAQAQSADSAAVRQELATMRAQMERMAERIDVLEARLAQANERAETATASANAANAAVAAAANAKPDTTIVWKGAPEIEGKGGWSFKPRGRVNFDAGTVSQPNGITDKGLGFANEIRRARLGVEGSIPGGFGYKFEMDFAPSSVEVTDALLSYKHGGLTVTAGQHNNFQSMEELTSSRFSSFMERAAFTDAFNFERRLGLSAAYAKGDLLLQGGVFTDNIEDLQNDENNSIGLDGRIVYAPKLGKTQLHLGGSIHWRDLGDAVTSVRYRQRPFVHFTDTRFIDTGNIGAQSETGYGLELAAINGPLHFAGEGYLQKVGRSSLPSATFFGGFAEVGYFLTKGDTRGYKGGTFDRVKPARGLDKGGAGAIQVNVRYDYLDLIDAGIIGGKQNGVGLSVIWTPTAYTRLMANYGHMSYDQAAVPAAGGNRNYSVDVFGMRAQLDF
ncbi:MAG: OprO/OprP family phosphate-selective porin [Novosphingobium sp.]